MSILSENQKKILALISKDKYITENFYLSGGTALAEYYLEHRLSEDLDFFSEKEFEPEAISVFFKKIKAVARIKEVKFEQSFNRNLFFLTLEDGDQIKTEFTYYPFERIEKGKKVDELEIDSLRDIAVNKIFTIYQKPRSRDFIDLYQILQTHKEFGIDDLAGDAQVKFEHYIDPLNLASQFVKAEVLKDYPRMIIDLPEKNWQEFFLKEAKRISAKSIKN